MTNASRAGIPLPPSSILVILEDVRKEILFYAYVCFEYAIYLHNMEDN